MFSGKMGKSPFKESLATDLTRFFRGFLFKLSKPFQHLLTINLKNTYFFLLIRCFLRLLHPENSGR